ncbi:MAG: WhiB family transcriptional regulator [Actinomycetota bacterium]|nr:WhiB family transcriptional regulator [Actinomycetota bacterium]
MSWARNRNFDQKASDWRRYAACNGCDVELFFPVGVTGPAVEQIEAAKEVCGHCIVRAECLDFALVTNQESGVWGGATEEERRKLRRSWLAQRRQLLKGGHPAATS